MEFRYKAPPTRKYLKIYGVLVIVLVAINHWDIIVTGFNLHSFISQLLLPLAFISIIVILMVKHYSRFTGEIIESGIDFKSFSGQQVCEIDKLNPAIIFTDGSLIVECPWRLRDNASIIVGFTEYREESTTNDSYERLKAKLVGKQITRIGHVLQTTDLFIELEDNLVLELFPDSSLYEGWQLFGPNGFLLVSFPGGSYT